MNILVTGGAGYVGGAVALALKRAGHAVTVMDNLSAGNYRPPGCRFIEGDIRSQIDCVNVFRCVQKINVVCHLAAVASVPESISDPSGYWETNLTGTHTLLACMRQFGAKRIVFSSTAAVYSHTDRPLSEESLTDPVTPYGQSKLAAEWLVKSYAAYGIDHVIFRYFNVVGAVKGHGEARKDEKHILPLLLASAVGKAGTFKLFGVNYPTMDGTCVRDYVHVDDIARAHVLAVASRKPVNATMNIARGYGYSNREVIRLCEDVADKEIRVEFAKARQGDPAKLVACVEKAKDVLGWEPKKDLRHAVESTWAWIKRGR